MSEQFLSHVDGDGNLQMVDVTNKAPSRRVAAAHCVVVTTIEVHSLAPSLGGLDTLVASRLAGIQAAKNTAQLIPLCHPLVLHDIQVEVVAHPRGVEVRSQIVTIERTGVEMEALSACTFAALTVLNALVALDPHANIEDLAVLSKSGGTSGDWGRQVDVH